MAYRSIQRRTKRRRARFRALAFEPAQVYQKALFEAGIRQRHFWSTILIKSLKD